ncbi:MAG: hypothetical protein RLO51_27255 [Thalassobaculum sp.]|uniref:hypothetical protein n=1 Tax=Thalassobaculum sp. TaxID=2022740 RepID=UPI0032EFF77B
MTTHRYERGAILGDYTRGGFGLLVTAGPVLFLPMVWWLAAAFAVCALLFVVYLFRTWQRGAAVIEVDDRGIRSTGPLGRAIRWDALEGLDLSYFATRRDKEGGWMQLRLRGDGSAIAAESSLDGFETVVERAAAAATRNRLALSHVTRENLRALGVAAGGSPQTLPQGLQPGDTASRSDDRVGMG